jgi:uncharacterized protein (DUF885 family)
MDWVAPSESVRLNAFFERTFEEDLDWDPEYRTFLGQKKDNHLLSDRSEKRQLEEFERAKQRLEELRGFAFEKLNDASQISYRIYELELQREIEGFPWRHHYYAITHNWGPHTGLPSFMINQHKVDSVRDAEAYILRLAQFGDVFDSTLEAMKQGQAIGVIPPQFVYPDVIEAVKNILTGAPFTESEEASPLFEDFVGKVDKLEIDNAQRAALKKRAADALKNSLAPAYQRLIAAVKELQLQAPAEGGLSHIPDGDLVYTLALGYHTTTDYSADYIHNLGLAEVERIHAEMRLIVEKVGFDGDLKAFFEHLQTSPEFKYPSTEAGRQQYLDDATRIIADMKKELPRMFSRYPKAELTVKAVEKFREQSSGVAFYEEPAEDGSRPGIYYVNLLNMSAVSKYELEALAYHEGLPGHHMERAITQEMEGLPDFRRYIWFTAHGEGWALYSEWMPKEFGLYQDPYSDFGRLSMELWRACRLVVDTGIHAKKWSFATAVAYVTDNTPTSESDSAKSIKRYTVDPGQATAYKIGMLKIQELRAGAEEALGADFDIRKFHDEMIRYGNVPFSVMEERVDLWVEGVQAAH